MLLRKVSRGGPLKCLYIELHRPSLALEAVTTCFLPVYEYVGEVLKPCLKPSAGSQLPEWNPVSTPSQVHDPG